MLEGIQSSLTKSTAGEVKLNVQVNEELVGKAFLVELKRVRHKVQVKGFRVGKAPLEMIRRLHGRAIAQNVTLTLIEDSLRRVAPAKGIWLPDDGTTPVRYAKMAAEGEIFSFTADLDGLLPVVKKMGEYKGLVLNRFSVLPPDLVDRGVAQIRSDKATTKPLPPETKVEKGHMVVVTHKATGEGFPTPPSFNLEQKSVVAGTDEAGKVLNDIIIGMKAGDTDNRSIPLPAETTVKGGQERKMHFLTKVHEIQEVIMPALDAQFVREVCGKDSVEGLRSYVESRLLKGLNRRVMEEQVVAQLLKSCEVEVPAHAVEKIITSLIMQTVGNDEKLGKRVLRDHKLRNSFRAKADGVAKIGAIQQAIAEQENIAPAKVIDFLIEQAEYKDVADVEKVKQMLSTNFATPRRGNDDREYVQAIVSASRVELGIYTGLQVQKRIRKVTPALVADEVEAMRYKDAKLKPADEAKVGTHHTILLSCDASVDGHPFDKLCFTKALVLMGRNNFPEQLENGIMGMATSEEKEVITTLTNSEVKVGSNSLEKKVIFKVVVHNIFEPELPDLDTESLAKIQRTATEKVTNRLAKWTQDDLEEQIGKHLLENSVFHISQADLNRVISEAMRQNVFAAGLCEAESILSGSTLRDDYTDIILSRAKIVLALEEIIRREGMEVGDNPHAAVMDFLVDKADIAVVEDTD